MIICIPCGYDPVELSSTGFLVVQEFYTQVPPCDTNPFGGNCAIEIGIQFGGKFLMFAK